jgi:hypothetical protein
MILFSVPGSRFELERLEIRAGGGRQRGTLFYYDSPEWRHRRRWWGARRGSQWRQGWMLPGGTNHDRKSY